MRFRFQFLILILFFVFTPFVQAQTKIIENSGFVPGNIWFSKTPTAVGEVVKIYTLVWNASAEDVSGTVTFFDNDTLIGKQSFILAGEGSTKILSEPWKVAAGYHKIYAQITDSVGGPRGTKAITVSLQYAKTEEQEQFVGAPKAADSGATTSAVSSYVGEKIDYAKGYIEANLPKPVISTTKAASNGLEALRSSASDRSKQAVTMLEKDLNVSSPSTKKTKSDNSETGFSIERPLKYVELFLLSVVAFVLGNTWLFYGIIVLVIFYILRFIKRKFFF